ncbi:MAG: glycosyltransferase [Nitrospirae bacterium]|nr:glycosyltransferase [Nitrospirota bacterium]
MKEQTEKKRILFFIYDLGGGGAERVLVNIIRNIDRSRFVPVLYLFSKKGTLLPLVPRDIEIISLDDVHVPEIFGLWFFFLFKRIRDQLNGIRPDILLSFMWYPNAIAIIVQKLMRGNLKVIVSERTSTSIYSSKCDNNWRNFIIRFLYPRANLIVAPSRKIAQNIISQTVPESKVRVIHNPVDISEISKYAKEEIDHKWYRKKESIVIAVGRLGNEKGFDYLIKAIALLSGEGIQCKLIILGDGKEKENLLRLVEKLGLNDSVSFEGFQENPYKYLARSTVFVLSSLYEGFPNVLLEAMALGIPSVATRCPTGPDEIITEGVDGILVPSADEKALAGAIERLVMDEDLRKRLGDAGRKRAQDFAIEKIVKQYEDAIESVCAESAER